MTGVPYARLSGVAFCGVRVLQIFSTMWPADEGAFRVGWSNGFHLSAVKASK